MTVVLVPLELVERMMREIPEQLAHVARGCRASTSHNPAPYEQAIADLLDELGSLVSPHNRPKSAADELGIESRERGEGGSNL